MIPGKEFTELLEDSYGFGDIDSAIAWLSSRLKNQGGEMEFGVRMAVKTWKKLGIRRRFLLPLQIDISGSGHGFGRNKKKKGIFENSRSTCMFYPTCTKLLTQLISLGRNI